MLDERLIRALHVEALRHTELRAEHEPHVLFQASTIGALLQGAYDGDVTFAELAQHGDLGLGTLHGLDGEQHVFELEDVAGTMLGFRFPDYSEGIEVSGYHLHFISEDRARGGHVLDCRTRSVHAALDPSSDLHVELPTGVELSAPDLLG